MRKRFGIDIDGTVTCPTSMIPFINKDFGLNITLSDVTEYDLTKVVDVPPEQFSRWFLEKEAIIYEHSPVASGAEKVLNFWKENHDLYFISARGADLLENTKRWFQQKGISFHHIELIGSHDKVGTAKRFDIDIFFEDKHDNAVMIHEECGIPVLLFNTPYNQDPVPKGVIRVNNWSEADIWVKNWLKK
nr:hypothetical protein [Neobacillus sp. Marseille-Q6967]